MPGLFDAGRKATPAATAWTASGRDEQARTAQRVRATLVTIIAVAGLLGLTEAALALTLAEGRVALALLSAATLGFAGALLQARRIALRNDLGAAVTWACGAIVGIQTAYLFLYPRAYAAICIASFVVVALALSFVTTRALLRITLVSWAVAAVAVVVGNVGRPLLPVPEEAAIPILVGSGLAAVTVGMALLWQFAHHMLHALEESRRMERSKSEFINTAAHELNTPLTPVLLQLSLLRSGKLAGAPQNRALDVVQRNVTRISSLVREMLDVARMQAGRLALRSGPVPLAEILHEAVGDYAAAAAHKGVALEVEGPPVVALGDRQRITQVVSNLLSNALRVTPSGGTIAVRLQVGSEGALVAVQDTGIGLSPDQLAKLFQPFTRIHEETAGTSGLGLYICRGLVEEMGGRLWAASDGPGRGATFSFTLPPLAGASSVPA